MGNPRWRVAKVQVWRSHTVDIESAVMPDIKLKNQPFDLKFHPSEAVLYAPLLTGEVKCWRYDDATGEASRAWSVRPTKRTARCVDVERNGTGLWMGGKNGSV